MAGEQPFDVNDKNRGKNIKVCDRVIEEVPDVGFHALWLDRWVDLAEAINDSVQERNVCVLAGHIVDVNSHGDGVFRCVDKRRKETLSVTEESRYSFRRTSVRHTHSYSALVKDTVLEVIDTHCDLGDQCIARVMNLLDPHPKLHKTLVFQYSCLVEAHRDG